MITWNTVRADTGRMEVIESYPDVEDALEDMRTLAWEEPTNHRADYLLDEETGLAVAVAIFGPSGELLVTLADGRRLTFEMPEGYRRWGGRGRGDRGGPPMDDTDDVMDEYDRARADDMEDNRPIYPPASPIADGRPEGEGREPGELAA